MGQPLYSSIGFHSLGRVYTMQRLHSQNEGAQLRALGRRFDQSGASVEIMDQAAMRCAQTMDAQV